MALVLALLYCQMDWVYNCKCRAPGCPDQALASTSRASHVHDSYIVIRRRSPYAKGPRVRCSKQSSIIMSRDRPRAEAQCISGAGVRYRMPSASPPHGAVYCHASCTWPCRKLDQLQHYVQRCTPVATQDPCQRGLAPTSSHVCCVCAHVVASTERTYELKVFIDADHKTCIFQMDLAARLSPCRVQSA